MAQSPSNRVRVQGLRKALSIFRKEIIKELRSKEMRMGIAKIVVNGIRRNKKPVTSEVTLAFREFYEQFNETHPDYSRNFINMTFTGQLLKDLEKNIRLEADRGVYTYRIAQSSKLHKGYKYKSGAREIKSGKRKGQMTKGKSRRTQKIAFNKISEYLYKKGYNYLDIDAKTLTEAELFIKNRLKAALAKRLKSQ